MLTRRSLVRMMATSAAAASLPACKLFDKPIPGRIVGAPAELGHRLRTLDFPAPTATRTAEAVVVGSGIAGLGAARQLKRGGVNDLLVFEAADMIGGNSASDGNSVSAYPWGAHYVPLVRADDAELLQLFHEMEIVTGFENDAPVYNEFFLSADPQERLFTHGRWQEGLLPNIGISQEDREQYRRFFALITELKDTKGGDGKPVFAIPIARSSTDEAWRALDRISMADFLAQRGLTSPPLNWYVNYCCRDDYGATSAKTSAWAGLHYFAARNGHAANASPTSVVTWPEGNGFFVRSWSAELKNRVETGSLTFAVSPTDRGATIDYFDVKQQRSVRVHASAVILAVPSYALDRIWSGSVKTAGLEYSPWAVANLTLDRAPQGRGMELAWDNVVQNSEMLGYVVANHQTPSRRVSKTVITYYWPLSHTEASNARREALARSHFDWQTLITADLYKTHPELIGQVANLDVMVWGHGMRRPTPGSIWGAAPAAESNGPIFVAHSDQSGISIFEEAFHRGLSAAQRCKSFLGRRRA